jgi:hypothetical protein
MLGGGGGAANLEAGQAPERVLHDGFAFLHAGSVVTATVIDVNDVMKWRVDSRARQRGPHLSNSEETGSFSISCAMPMRNRQRVEGCCAARAVSLCGIYGFERWNR